MTNEKEKNSGQLLDGLGDLDAAIVKTQGGTGEPGSGLFALLSELATQFMGVPRLTPTSKVKEPEKEPEKHEPPKSAPATAAHAPPPGARK
jgi:hypothetical protein